MVYEIQKNFSESKAREIDSIIFDLYNITEDERNIIDSIGF